jgi:hypothetical protein
MARNCNLSKGPSINDVSSEGEGGGTSQKPMKGDENRYLVLGKADVVFDIPKGRRKCQFLSKFGT